MNPLVVMDPTVFDADMLTNIVRKMLRCFKEWNSEVSIRKMKYSHIDVMLFKNDTMYYTIQVTNYGQSTDDVLLISRKIFLDIITTNINFDNSLIAKVYNRNEHSNCHEMLELHVEQNRLSLKEITNDNNHVEFIYQKKYLSFLLQNKLCSLETEKFINDISNEIILLQQSNSRIKFTVHVNKKVLHSNYIALDNDYKSCQVLASTLTSVIKQSLDVKFKEYCFSILDVENSHQAETALMIKLLPLIHENYIFPCDK